MRLAFLCVCLTSALGVARAAQPPFSASLSPEDFAAAGLGKLTPAERAHLDALIRGQRAAAPPAAVAAPVAAAAAEKPAASASSSLLGRAKVLLTPGTQVEYAAVEGRLAGTFTGWEGKAVFTLKDGQRWQIANPGSSYFGPPLVEPAVRLTPAPLGTFWLQIEGVGQRVKVVPLNVGR